MPVPYNDQSIAVFMQATLRNVAAVLRYTIEGGSYAPMIANLKSALGVDDLSTLTEVQDIRRVEAGARYFAWLDASTDLITAYDFSNAAGSFQRNQMLKGASAQLSRAEAQAIGANVIPDPNGTPTSEPTNDPNVMEIIPIRTRTPYDPYRGR